MLPNLTLPHSNQFPPYICNTFKFKITFSPDFSLKSTNAASSVVESWKCNAFPTRAFYTLLLPLNITPYQCYHKMLCRSKISILFCRIPPEMPYINEGGQVRLVEAAARRLRQPRLWRPRPLGQPPLLSLPTSITSQTAKRCRYLPSLPRPEKTQPFRWLWRAFNRGTLTFLHWKDFPITAAFHIWVHNTILQGLHFST